MTPAEERLVAVCERLAQQVEKREAARRIEIDGQLYELTEATEDEAEDYRRRLRKILDRSDKLDEQGVQAARKLIARLQEAVVGRIGMSTGQTEWTMFYLPRLLSAVEGVAADFSKRYGVAMEELLPEAHQVGTDLVDEGLTGPGFTAQLPVIDRTSIEVLSQFSPDMVQGLEATVMEQLKKQFTLSMAQGDSLGVAMEKLRGPLSRADSPWKSLTYRTELVARTEISRVQGLGAQARMEQAKEKYPGLKIRKQFLAAHIGDYPCPQCAKHDGNVWDVDDPDAPEVPVHPNCRCVFAPSVSVGADSSVSQEDA